MITRINKTEMGVMAVNFDLPSSSLTLLKLCEQALDFGGLIQVAPVSHPKPASALSPSLCLPRKSISFTSRIIGVPSFEELPQVALKLTQPRGAPSRR